MTEDRILDFKEALYRSYCGKCRDRLMWEAEFDADGTSYVAYCCGFVYSLYPHTVKMSVEEEED